MGLKRYEIYYWVFVILFLALIIPLQFYWPVVAQFRYTRQLPVETPGGLTSDIWSWAQIRESFYAFAYLIILSGLFMIFSKNTSIQTVHTVILAFFALWFIVMFVYDLRDLSVANVGPNESGFRPYNPARSSFWCCLYGLDPKTSRICANTALCVLPSAGLTTNPDFVFRFVLNVMLFIFVTIDLVFTNVFWGKALRENFKTDTMADIESKIQQRKLRKKRYELY